MEVENISYRAELPSGTVLNNGKYIIEKKIGQGGFGITYKAVQSGLGRTVCIKEYFVEGKCIRNTQANTVMLSGLSSAMFEKYRHAFVQEAQTLAQLHHPGIVEVVDVFDENGTSYMVMPFIEGKSLQSIVEKNGPLSYPEAVNYIAQITNAVGYIHGKNILHRDIKPDNIMITPDYKTILIDFGSARKFQHDKTQAQTSILTPGYAPVEQYNTNSRKGSYTDIYAIGATMYFIVTGKQPMDSPVRYTERMPEPKELNPSIPDEGNRTILKAMQIKAENRHQTVQEFMDDLRNIRPSKLVDETIGGAPQPVAVNSGNTKKLWIGIGVAAVVIIALVALLMRQPKDQNTGRISPVIPGQEQPEEELVVTQDFSGTTSGYPMVWVEGGTFIMGSDETDQQDCPKHSVTLDGYWIGQYEVTQGLWKEIMGKNPSAHQHVKRPNGTEYTPKEHDRLPVENISYNEIEEFITKLNKRTGQNFALPTEAQWEFAARGGNESKGGKWANGGGQGPNGIWYKQEHPIMVDVKEAVKPNELGIYQMSGNVAEWCRDLYDEEFYSTSDNNYNPVCDYGNKHVIRGGSYENTDIEGITVFYRDSDRVSRSRNGFRLVLTDK